MWRYIYICTLSENKFKKMFALQAMDTDRKANPQWVFLLAWFATCGNIFFLTVNVSILCLSSNVKITKTTAQLYWKECKQASLLLFSIVSIICHVALHCCFKSFALHQSVSGEWHLYTLQMKQKCIPGADSVGGGGAHPARACAPPPKIR
jgi:hypothetical protein